MHPYSRQTINQLLAEMDGCVLHQKYVVFVNNERIHIGCEGVCVSTLHYLATLGVGKQASEGFSTREMCKRCIQW